MYLEIIIISVCSIGCYNTRLCIHIITQKGPIFVHYVLPYHLFRFVSICFVSFCFVSFRFVSFRFDLFRFVSICFVSFRSVSFRSVSFLFRFALYRDPRVITEHFDPPKTSGLWLVVEHFYGLKQIWTVNSLHSIQQGHISVLEREFGTLDPYC